MGVVLNWSSGYIGTPASIDDVVANFPTLTDGVHDVLSSHVNQLAQAVIQLETIQSGLSALTVKDEGITLSNAVTAIDFAGAGVTASGTTSVTVSITGDALGAASGDLSGTYPGPTVIKLQNNAVSAAAPVADNLLYWSGTAWTPAALAGDVTGGLTAVTVTKLQNVAVSAVVPASLDLLSYDGVNWAGTSTPTVSSLTVTGTGTVDGRDVSVDGSTLDAHVGSTANPHSTSIANIGSGTLAQLNAALSDATLFEKLTIITDATVARTVSDSDNNSLLVFTNVAAITVDVAVLSPGVRIWLVFTEPTSSLTIQALGSTTLTLVAKPSATTPLRAAQRWSTVSITGISNTGGSEFGLVDGDLG